MWEILSYADKVFQIVKIAQKFKRNSKEADILALLWHEERAGEG